MARGADRAPSQRQLRVGEELRHALAWIVERGELRDPALKGIALTVTEVRVSPDLKNATAFVVPLGEADLESVIAALNHAQPFFRKRIAASVRLKYVPKIGFRHDDSFDEAAHIDSLLHDPHVAQDLAPPEDDEDDHGA